MAWFPAASGFLVGAGFLRLVDTWTPQLAVRRPGMLKQRSLLEDNPKAFMLVSAITIHNIPEGLAVGVAFGALADAGSGSGSLAAAIALAIGIGIQNVPEGVAVAVPLRAAGWSRWRSFWYGQMSAIVEPIAAVAGALAVRMFTPLLPYALGFAAGAMILVVVAELIPESQSDAENRNAATIAVLAGFLVMMILDVSL